LHDCFYEDASFEERKELLNIWDLPGFNGIHIADYLSNYNINK